MATELNQFYLRQVNCLLTPERQIVEVFRSLVFGVMVNPLPKALYDGLWTLALWGDEPRRASFEASFQLVTILIDEFEFVITLIPEWFIAYNAAVESGEAPITELCPCSSY